MFNKYAISSIKNIIFVTTIQSFLLLLFLFFIFYKFDYKTALSGLYGGITSISSFLIFFIIYYSIYNKNTSAKIIIRKFYVAVFIKILFLIIVLCFLLKTGIYSPVCFFIFLFIMQLTFWLLYAYFLMEI